MSTNPPDVEHVPVEAVWHRRDIEVYGITGDTDDARLTRITELVTERAGGVAAAGLPEHLRAIRDELAEVFTCAELAAARRQLGVTAQWLATYLDTTERTVLRWESGTTPLPRNACDAIRELLAEAQDLVERDAQEVLADETVTYLTMPRNAAQIDEMGEEVRQWLYPAGWHQQICIRIAEQVRRASGRRLRLYFLDEAPHRVREGEAA